MNTYKVLIYQENGYEWYSYRIKAKNITEATKKGLKLLNKIGQG